MSGLPQPGETWNDRYEITAELGRGGFGRVFKARDTLLERPVAIKMARATDDFTETDRQRFRRETSIAAGLKHRNIVTVYDGGDHDGLLFLVMQFVQGHDLRREVARGPIDGARAVAIVRQVGAALDHAHGRGLVHRDVKPGNILCEDGGDMVYLADFGISRRIDQTTDNAVTQGLAPATVAYAAPEQMRADARVDGRADQYGLGCVLFECLTGRRPFRGDVAAVISGHLHQPAPKVSKAGDGLSKGWDAVLARAMAKEPADRYTQCSDLARAAEEVLGLSRSKTERRSGAGRSRSIAQTTPVEWRRRLPWSGRSRTDVNDDADGGAGVAVGPDARGGARTTPTGGARTRATGDAAATARMGAGDVPTRAFDEDDTRSAQTVSATPHTTSSHSGSRSSERSGSMSSNHEQTSRDWDGQFDESAAEHTRATYTAARAQTISSTDGARTVDDRAAAFEDRAAASEDRAAASDDRALRDDGTVSVGHGTVSVEVPDGHERTRPPDRHDGAEPTGRRRRPHDDRTMRGGPGQHRLAVSALIAVIGIAVLWFVVPRALSLGDPARGGGDGGQEANADASTLDDAQLRLVASVPTFDEADCSSPDDQPLTGQQTAVACSAADEEPTRVMIREFATFEDRDRVFDGFTGSTPPGDCAEDRNAHHRFVGSAGEGRVVCRVGEVAGLSWTLPDQPVIVSTRLDDRERAEKLYDWWADLVERADD